MKKVWWRGVAGIAILAAVSGCSKKTGSNARSITDTSAVALLRKPVSDVKMRPASGFVWRPAANKSPLNNYDAVRTGSHSSAMVDFNDATKLSLGQLTMIIVLDKSKHIKPVSHNQYVESDVALPSGSLEGRIDANANPPQEVVVRTRRAWIRASRQNAVRLGGELRFHAEVTKRGALKVHSERGQVELLAQGKKRVVHQNETVTVAAPKRQPQIQQNAKPEDFLKLPKVSDAAWRGPSKAAQLDQFKILEPKNHTKVNTSSIRVSGILTGRLKVYVRGHAIKANQNGNFAIELPLKLGINILTFQIVDRSKIKYKTIEVLRK